MPDKMSQEKVKLLRAFGAEVVITPTAVAPDHPDHYLETAKRIALETPGAVLANQFYNPANPEAHYRSTGPELWEQSEGRITHFFAGAGTGGTLTGTGRFLKEQNPAVRIVGAQSMRTAAMARSVAAGHVVEIASERTLADGLAGQIDDDAEAVELGHQFMPEIGDAARDRLVSG
jgi:cystathionine beta-synthase